MGTDTPETVQNYLVPKMEKASSDEVDALCKKYVITRQQLPHIKITDAGLSGLGVGQGDVVKIHRKSWLTGDESLYYRQVVD